LGRVADLYGPHQVMLNVAAMGVLPGVLFFVLPTTKAAEA
jgi:hypothetical protein